MKRILFCPLFFLMACAPQAENGSGPLTVEASAGIFGGRDVGSNERLASLVVGLYDHDSGAKCTGTLIADDVVLTAAHCVNPKSSELSVVFSTRFSDKAQMRKSRSFIQHPRFNPNRTDGENTYDLALVRFDGGIPAGYQKVSLSNSFDGLAQLKAPFVAAGYGNSNPYFGTGSGVLRTVILPFRKIHSETEFQTSQSSQGVCSGDSGGPLFKEIQGQLIQVGVASRVAPRTLFCRDYAVYTRVDVYLNWIESALAADW